MSRMPIRLRVTLVFAAVMALVLVAVGLFLYVRLGDQLDESIDNGLRTRGTESPRSSTPPGRPSSGRRTCG